jgi:hypothetical protein
MTQIFRIDSVRRLDFMILRNITFIYILSIISNLQLQISNNY